MTARRTLAPHGTDARYNHRTQACRCDECRAGHAAYMRSWRARWRAQGPGWVRR